jgi:hypothetical protein
MMGITMMTDRELLELAARANWSQDLANDEVGLRYSEPDEGILYLHADNQDHNGHDREFVWNPLESNHDAFELAVKLRIAPVFHEDHVFTGYETVKSARRSYHNPITERFGTDAAAAVRRAIVRRAAVLGERLEVEAAPSVAGKEG